MDVGLPISQQAAVVGAAALTAAAAYVNAKLSIGRDLKTIKYEKSFGQRLGAKIKELGDTCTLYNMFDQVDESIDLLWFEGRDWTYGEMKKDVHRLAAFLENEGIKKGDAVAVFTTNSPEMVIIYLALSKLGAICGFINVNLRDATLEHCLKVSQANTIISTPDLAPFITGPRRHFTLSLYAFPSIPPPPPESLVTLLTSESLPTPTTITPATKATVADLSCLIFTSGTTGKPKACAIRNHLCILTAVTTSPDYFNPSKYFPLRTYSPLPLFHGTAFFTGVAYSIGNAGTVCLARKFSSSRFFKDVHDSRATRILYVGELCRYLLSTPPGEYDKKHNCIVASGNGLRFEIWEKFKERFGIEEVREFYRSTEGVAKFDNYNRGAWGAGKVGFRGFYRRNFHDDDTLLIKVDTDSGELIRDPKTGFCQVAGLGEAGEVIGRVRDEGLLIEYLGNVEATQEKIVRDVFKKGDIWQKMGDLLIYEREGWVRFHDRMGDTFRWKGENVSAGEVRDHIAKLDGVQDAVVFGVKLASYDGQAGAAMLTLESTTDEADTLFMSTMYSGLKKTGLPSYAMPRLVRITKEIETTATFKKSKTDIVKRSWDASTKKDQDKLYWLDGTVYRPLDLGAWKGIEEGRAKL